MRPAESSAVFISYASEDVAAARRICELLRGQGIEVWFDQSELRGGEAWDATIRAQIRACTLFVAVISAHTEDRAEGYFRREWRLAIERMHDLADDEPFLVPVVVDNMTTGLRVPDRFHERQWAWLDETEESAAVFASRVVRLLEGKTPATRPPFTAHRPAHARAGLATAATPQRAVRIHAHPAGHNSRAAPVAGRTWKQKIFGTHVGLLGIAALIFATNYLETAFETWVKGRFQLGRTLEREVAMAIQASEGGLGFERHDMTNLTAVYAGSIAYFFVFPALLIGMLIGVGRRRDLEPCRVGVFGVALAYAISLPFFIGFPVIERWAHPESEAILLSDLWSSALVGFVRPFSGIDNCFPSFHASATVVIVAVGYLYRARYRHSGLLLGGAVVLSTFILGIHWVPDILAGVCTGVIAVRIARWINRRHFSGPPDSWPPMPLASAGDDSTPQVVRNAT